MTKTKSRDFFLKILALVDRKQFWKVFHKTKKKTPTILTSQNFNNFKKLDFLSEINIKAD